MHSSLIGKVEKANRYARELDRITIERLALTFRGDNDTHHVSLDAGQWHCTCHYFESWGSCVHLLTLQKVFGVMLPRSRRCRSSPQDSPSPPELRGPPGPGRPEPAGPAARRASACPKPRNRYPSQRSQATVAAFASPRSSVATRAHSRAAA